MTAFAKTIRKGSEPLIPYKQLIGVTAYTCCFPARIRILFPSVYSLMPTPSQDTICRNASYAFNRA